MVATKTYTSELVLLCLIALDLARRRAVMSEAEVVGVVKELRDLPAKIEVI